MAGTLPAEHHVHSSIFMFCLFHCATFPTTSGHLCPPNKKSVSENIFATNMAAPRNLQHQSALHCQSVSSDVYCSMVKTDIPQCVL